MSRPTTMRTASTNLSAGSSGRALEGKLAIVTGGSRGMYHFVMSSSRVCVTVHDLHVDCPAFAPPSLFNWERESISPSLKNFVHHKSMRL